MEDVNNRTKLFGAQTSEMNLMSDSKGQEYLKMPQMMSNIGPIDEM